MGDTWQKVNAGSELRFSAKTYNALIDAAKWYADSQGVGSSSAPRSAGKSPFIKVQNNTGKDLDAGAVVKLGEPVFDPADGAQALASFKNNVWFLGEVATPGASDALAMFLEATPIDGVGLAAVSGAWPVLLNVQSEGDKRADVTDDDPTTLTTGSRGPFQVVWAADGTGEQHGVVLFGADVRSDFQVRNDTGADLTTYQIVGLSGPVNVPSYLEDYDEDATAGEDASDCTMKAVSPVWPTHVGKFAIVQADIADGDTGPAIVSGLTKVQVDFGTNPSAGYADIAEASESLDHLTAMATGAAQIIWSESTLGIAWAVVRVGLAPPETIMEGVLAEELSPGGSAQAAITIAGEPTPCEVWDYLLKDDDEPLAPGTLIVVAYMNGKVKVIEAQCP
ncbi:MAG: hypothetical protein PHU85_03975 [Phycisphaerae bacterium]|nr:hypothetical protein [Phycisphaerae bacterium]